MAIMMKIINNTYLYSMSLSSDSSVGRAFDCRGCQLSNGHVFNSHSEEECFHSSVG